MAQLFQCDVCGKVNVPDDTVMVGRPLEYIPEGETRFGISINTIGNAHCEHVCRACVLGAVREMMRTITVEEAEKQFKEEYNTPTDELLTGWADPTHDVKADLHQAIQDMRSSYASDPATGDGTDRHVHEVPVEPGVPHPRATQPPDPHEAALDEHLKRQPWMAFHPGPGDADNVMVEHKFDERCSYKLCIYYAKSPKQHVQDRS